MQKGKIGVTTENIFPIIKKFLYSDHEIFLRELVSNAVDASQKIKTFASLGDFKEELGDLKVTVKVDPDKKIITVSDNGIGMTADEIDKYINQIAFSSAEEFLDKYKNQANSIIGHFGLGFYSSFMVSEKVEIITKSYKEGEKAVKWSCDGSPEFEITEVEKEDRGTDIILYIDEESKAFASESKVQELLNKYCKFLPVPIAFGKQKEWKDDKNVETDKDNIVNNIAPAWTKKPADLSDEDYNAFYHELYPAGEEPLFNIHLNVDYPFNLTGILYFPKIRNNIEIQRNKIQLYSNQVFVTDSVEDIVPDFLTLLHGVLDSPDIPLNVSRSFLQSDSNVKKISSHISKKVADRLFEIFKDGRSDFEKKWDDLKLFIEYGMISDEKFYERAEKFALLKNTDSKYFTFEEYKTLIKENQKDKDDTIVYLYATNIQEQYSYIEAAKTKGYDVLILDGQFDTHFINQLEQKFDKSKFARVDSDIIDKLIVKDEKKEISLTQEQQDLLRPVFNSILPTNSTYLVSFEPLEETDQPTIITQAEFMRRMKEMSALNAGMGFYNQMPDTYNFVINANHPLIAKILVNAEKSVGEEISKLNDDKKPLNDEKATLEKEKEGKKEEEISQEVKDKIEEVEKKISEVETKKEDVLTKYGKKNKVIKQVVDLALLANNMLKGEDLTKFVKRSVDIIKIK